MHADTGIVPTFCPFAHVCEKILTYQHIPCDVSQGKLSALTDDTIWIYFTIDYENCKLCSAKNIMRRYYIIFLQYMLPDLKHLKPKIQP